MSSACVYIRIAAIPNSAPSARRRPNAKGHLPLPCRFLTQSRKMVCTGMGKDPRVAGMGARNYISLNCAKRDESWAQAFGRMKYAAF